MTGIPAKDATIAGYADKVLALIDADMTAQVVPADATTWDDLGDHVDTNSYFLDADVPWGTDPGSGTDGFGTVNAVYAEVGRRLAARSRP